MEKRRSIEVPGVKHVNPIPAACRRGPFVVSGAIGGADPETGKVPEDLDAQCRLHLVHRLHRVGQDQRSEAARQGQIENVRQCGVDERLAAGKADQPRVEPQRRDLVKV